MPSDGLTEQAATFQYNYRLRCQNGHPTPVSAAVFESQWHAEDGAISCETCGHPVPARNENLAARADDDPALDSQQISDLAWYHTSTHDDWPRPDYAMTIAEELRTCSAMLPAEIYADVLRRAQTKAFHVGTYESAIENMHRRIWNEGYDDSQFYLHRVALSLSADDIDPTIRHESHEEASQIAIEDLGRYKAVRYINVEESPGSISLAITPSAIATIQTVAIPTTLVVGPPSEVIRRAAAALDAELAPLEQELERLPQSKGFLQEILLRRQGDTETIRRHELDSQITCARREFIAQLSHTYLDGINPIAREHLTRVVSWPQGATAAEFHEIFRTHAALMTGGADLVAELARQPPRTPNRRGV